MVRTVKLRLFNTNSKSNQLDNIFKEYSSIYNKSSIDFHRFYRTNNLIKKPYPEFGFSKLGSRIYTEASLNAYSTFKGNHNRWIKESDKKKNLYPKNGILKNPIINFSNTTGEIIQDNQNSFPLWLSLINPFNKGHRLLIPTKPTKVFNKYKDWNLGTSFNLIKRKGTWYINLFFSKPSPELKSSGKSIGIDVGLNKLGTTSNNEILGEKVVINKKRLTKSDYEHQKNDIGKLVNSFNLDELKLVAMENIKNIHKNKSNTSHNRKLYFKVKSKIFNKRLSKAMLNYFITLMQRRCEENGVLFTSVSPYYTSQRCSRCGYKHKSNRNKDKFQCTHCNLSIDADTNGARNILTLALGLWDNKNPSKEDGIYMYYNKRFQNYNLWNDDNLIVSREYN